MQYVTVDDRLASILVQRATGHENLEAYGTSPIIHSVFHDSVENQALKMQQGSCLVRFFVEHAVKISVEVQEKISGAAACLLRTMPLLSTSTQRVQAVLSRIPFP